MDVRKYDIYCECLPEYLTSEQNQRVSYPVQHECTDECDNYNCKNPATTHETWRPGF